MLLDKKVKNNEMTYVLPKNIGEAYITNKIKKNIVIKALKDHVK
jgi:3-dehydroquinate synthetase